MHEKLREVSEKISAESAGQRLAGLVKSGVEKDNERIFLSSP